MAPPSVPQLSFDQLERIALASANAPPCAVCAKLICPGWESVRAGVDRDALRCLGTLADPADEDPTVAEHHPEGTNRWSSNAPIAWGHFPYNRCEVWQCTKCPRAFLRYTEYGATTSMNAFGSLIPLYLYERDELPMHSE